MDATTSQVQESPLPPGTEELKKWVKEQIDAEVVCADLQSFLLILVLFLAVCIQ